MHNLIIAGIGGQGINRLAHVVGMTCHAHGLTCQFTVHKGGAQSLGSVYAEFRISSLNLPISGPGIPSGQLDTLIAMEAWEGLRHLSKANHATTVYVETAPFPLFVERRDSAALYVEQTDPLTLFSELSVKSKFISYREQAMTLCRDVKMANYFAGIDCLHALGIKDKRQYQDYFFGLIPAAAKHKRSLV
jgi:Pyruvate/2-oxoacid:ferredoxin oxidoreductase gamma subunit